MFNDIQPHALIIAVQGNCLRTVDIDGNHHITTVRPAMAEPQHKELDLCQMEIMVCLRKSISTSHPR